MLYNTHKNTLNQTTREKDSKGLYFKIIFIES